MKIGIITFHWSTNYGAVLQVYALQEFLKQNPQYEVNVINFAPFTNRESLLRCFVTRHISKIPSFVLNYFKELKFVPFRAKYLSQTKRFYSLKELTDTPPVMDAYICGSDQVWNPYIVNQYGPAYFLPFGDAKTKRIAYAVSFGCIDYPKDVMQTIKPLIERFDNIAVRENTGLSILKNAGISRAVIMPDPTLLMSQEMINSLIGNNSKSSTSFVFFYILQEKQLVIESIADFISKNHNVVSNKQVKHSSMDVESWLKNIRDSEFVITNSFHGAVFSILLEKKFLVVPVEGKMAGMNDRIDTLLQTFGLENRLYSTLNQETLDKVINEKIDWNKIRNIKDQLKDKASSYFNEALAM